LNQTPDTGFQAFSPEEEIISLIGELNDKNYPKRQEAANRLTQIGNPAVAYLKNALLSDPDDDTKYWATIILGRIGDTAINVLMEVLTVGDKDLKIFALRAIGEALDTRALPHLVKTLGDKSWSVRKNAASSMIKFGDAAIPMPSPYSPNRSRRITKT